MSRVLEEEARKTKRCQETFGRSEVQNCLGSECMAFRWSRAQETQAYIVAVQKRMKETGEIFPVATNKVFAQSGNLFEKTEGYCGKAGKPE